MREGFVGTLRQNAATIVVGIVVLAAIVASFVFLGPWHMSAGARAHVVVHDGDGNTQTVSLDESRTLEVSTSLGNNTIVIEQGEVRISEADCPKQSCTHQKPISVPGEQLICLPHKLWVEITEDEDSSSQLDENAVTWMDNQDVDVVSQ